MSNCCGDKRAALKARLRAEAQAAQGTLATPEVADPAQPAPLRQLCYRSGIGLAVAGPVTGRTYVFRPGRQPTEVDADDALALLETGRYEALD